jgi:hypothetical protein
MGKTINQEIRDHLQHIAGDDDLERDIEYLRRISGLGCSEPGWKFNRDEIYEDRVALPEGPKNG